MDDGFPFLDIILLAMIAGFIILRLRSVLGRRTGHQEQRPNRFEGSNGPSPADADDNVTPLHPGVVIDADAVESPHSRELERVRLADPTFSVADFLTGASSAFEMIIGAYAAGDKARLKGLLSDQVYSRFVAAIDEREERGETAETEIISVKRPELEDVELDGPIARLSVRFTSEQVNLIRDSEGRIIEGDPNQIENLIDVWTFERDTHSRDPNWLLTATRSVD